MSDITYSIRVVDEDGDPVEGIEVAVHYAWTHSKERTDEDGWAQFEVDVTGNGIRATVYVDGENMGEPWLEDGDTLSYTRP